MNATITSNNASEYIMGRTAAEYERLNRQAKIWEPITRRILMEAGLQKGMRCLDVGCGTGAVMKLMGNITGKEGTVTGFDADESLGNYAVDILNKDGDMQYSFEQGNIEESDVLPGIAYDFVYSRFFLLHLYKPEIAIKKMYDALKPGGILLLQDYDFSTLHFSKPVNEVDGYFRQLMLDTFSGIGKDPLIGIRLSYYINKAIGKEADATDASSVITPAATTIAMMRSVLENMLPAMKKLGVANENDLVRFVKSCEEFLLQEKDVSALWPLLGSAWVTK